MDNWQMWFGAGIALIILEMFTPVLFLLSLGVACIFSSGIAYLGFGLIPQVAVFSVVSIVMIFFIRPLFMKSISNKNSAATGIKRYLTQNAKVIETIDNSQNKGRVRIFDEEWRAVSKTGEVFEVGKYVVIVEIQGMTFYVDKLGES